MDELNDMIANDKVEAYKLGKIMFRSSVADSSLLVNYPTLRQDVERFFNDSMARKIEYRAELDPKELISLYEDVKRIRAIAATTNEDDFPTLTDCYATINIDGKQTKPLLQGTEKLQIQNVEHALLSALLVASRDMGESFALYEASKIESNELPETEIKALAILARALLYFEKELLYLSIDNTSQNIDWLQANDGLDVSMTKKLFKWKQQGNTQAYQALLGTNYAFRGITRLKTEREIDEERALEDFVQFIECGEKAGLENELIWVAQVYVYLNNKEYNKAITPLKKLEKSPLPNKEDQRSISETIKYLEQRKEDEVMTGLYDKAFVVKLASRYVLSQLSKVDWQQELENQNVLYAEEAFATFNQFLDFLEELNRYSLKGGLDKVGEKTKETGKSLWNKAKEIAD